jgi:TolB-like protein
METRQTPNPALVRSQLERILASAPFANSARSQRFLRYVVEGSLNNSEDSLKEYVIAVEVFDRDPSYDSSVDATVRVEAGRLRTRLRDYYSGAGRNDPLLIEIPRGSYRPTFQPNAAEFTPPPPFPANVQDVSYQQEEPALEPQLRRKMWKLSFAVAALVLLLAGTAIGYFATHRAQSSVSPKTPVVLAVLPFTNKTGLAANDYLTDGLTDNLIRQLSQLPQLRIVSRGAVESVDRQSLSGTLGVTVLLAGELRRNADGRLQLNSELSNAKDGTVLRSEQYLPDESDFRPIQADIVQDVIRTLGFTPNQTQFAAALRPLTSSPAAFQDFLRAETLMENGDESSLVSALSTLDDAVKRDRFFAEAFAAMAESELQIGLYFELPGEHMERARQYASRSIALDPRIIQSHAVLGLVHLMYDWDYAGAQSELAAADLREGAIGQFGCTAHLLERSGNTRHAEEDLHRLLDFNPRSALLIGELGCVNYYAARYDDSIRYYHQALALAPQSVLSGWGLGRSLARVGKYAEALDELKHFKSAHGVVNPLILAEIGYIQALSGDRSAARATVRQLQQMERSRFVDPYFVAVIELALNDQNATYAWLEKAYSKRSSFLISIATDPKWSASMGDPRFQALWARMTGGGLRSPQAVSAPSE